MKNRLILLTTLLVSVLHCKAQISSVSDDKSWELQTVTLKNTSEADYIIRIGDVDNLNFGWLENFDPFCSRMSEAHIYPWTANDADMAGFDRILMSSKYNPNIDHMCGGDGYSGSFDANLTKPVPYSIPTSSLRNVEIKNAYLQIFIDDFQSPTFCSKFQITLNGTRFAEGEKILNAIDQTGPVGKLVTIPLPEEFYQTLGNNNSLIVSIDETTGSADGFAIDFIRILINRKRLNSCKGNIKGRVLEKGTDIAIPQANVFTSDNISTSANSNGEFAMNNIPTGFEVIRASASGYADGSANADIGQGDDNNEVIIYLEKGKKVANFNNKKISVGEAINLNNIMFEAAKSTLKTESIAELNKVVDFMRSNEMAEIELSGHTSSEGEAIYNRSLSYKRVKACKDYIVGKGIDPGRIIAVGYGPDRPIAPNDTELNRAKNRRVEMRLTKL